MIKQKRSAARCPWSDFAILYRNHWAAQALVEELGAQNIPMIVDGGDLLETDNMRDLLAALSCMVSLDDNVSLFRLALMPRFGVDANALRAALQIHSKSSSVVAALERSDAGRELIAELKRISARVNANAKEVSARAAFERTAREFALDRSPETPFFLQQVADWMGKGCVGAKACSGSLAEFLDYLALWRDAGGRLCAQECDDLGARRRKIDHPDAVSLSTVHGAKGLEFRYVFIARVSKPSFPTASREVLFDFPQALRKSTVPLQAEAQLHEAEERRLFYVALTRARDHLTLLGKHGSKNKVDIPPSGYMRDLANAAELRGKILVRSAEPVQLPLIQAAAATPWYDLPALKFADGLRLSASAIETYAACPKKFYFRYEWNLPGEPASALLYGSAVHKALAALFAAHRLGKPLPLAALLETFAANFTATGFTDLHHHKLLLEQGRKRLTEFYARQHAAGFPAVLATEHRFSIEVDGVTLIGSIDRVDGAGAAVSVMDYKSGNPKSEEQAEKSTQLAIYALAAESEWKQQVAAIAFYNLETNEEVSASVTPAVLAAVHKTIAETAADIRKGDFAATPGTCCNWCDYRELCPATVQKFFAPQQRNAETAQR